MKSASARLVKRLTMPRGPTDTGTPTETSGLPGDRGGAKSKSTVPSARAPARNGVVLRAITALGETRLLLLLAAIITAGSGLWAWSLATTAFAAPPKLVVPPGIIGAAIESSGSSVLTPIDIQVIYNPAPDQTGTNFQPSVEPSHAKPADF